MNRTVKMKQDKQCKGSVRYAVPESEKEKSAITNVYVERAAFPAGMPEEIEVEVRAVA